MEIIRQDARCIMLELMPYEIVPSMVYGACLQATNSTVCIPWYMYTGTRRCIFATCFINIEKKRSSENRTCVSRFPVTTHRLRFRVDWVLFFRKPSRVDFRAPLVSAAESLFLFRTIYKCTQWRAWFKLPPRQSRYKLPITAHFIDSIDVFSLVEISLNSRWF